MKVAYIFSTSGHTASYKLGKMILPQLEERRHGVEVVGMMFFDDKRGNLVINSEKGRGTRVYILLPAYSSQNDPRSSAARH